jgi:archaeosine synthase
VVPRELELFYPATQYDVPVTGIWYADEIKMITENLSWLVKRYRYEQIISHLPDRPWLTECLPNDVEYSSEEGKQPTARESIESLARTLKDAVSGYETVPPAVRMYEDLTSFARFQFGEAGARLLEDTTIKGKYPNLRIFDSGKQLGMLNKDRGMITLTLEGGQKLIDVSVKGPGGYYVEIEDFFPRGNIFAAGVVDADPVIRIGDEVVVIAGKELRAVGVATMSAQEMVQASTGVAVKVRHRKTH